MGQSAIAYYVSKKLKFIGTKLVYAAFNSKRASGALNLIYLTDQLIGNYHEYLGQFGGIASPRTMFDFIEQSTGEGFEDVPDETRYCDNSLSYVQTDQMMTLIASKLLRHNRVTMRTSAEIRKEAANAPMTDQQRVKEIKRLRYRLGIQHSALARAQEDGTAYLIASARGQIAEIESELRRLGA